MTHRHPLKKYSKKFILNPVESQGGQVGYSPDFHPGGLGLAPVQGNQQKKSKPPSVS